MRRNEKAEQEQPEASSSEEKDNKEDRKKLVDRMLSVLKPEELCADELSGISAKQLCAILDVKHPPTGIELSSTSSSSEEISQDSISSEELSPESISSEEISPDSISSEGTSSDSISSDEEINKKRKHRYFRREKQKRKFAFENSGKDRSAKRPRLNVSQILAMRARMAAMRVQQEPNNTDNINVNEAPAQKHASVDEERTKEASAEVVDICKDEKPKREKLQRGTKRAFSTGAPMEKHAAHDEVKIKEEPAKVVDICSEGEKPKGEKLQRGTKRDFSIGAPMEKHASPDEVKIKEEPAEVIEISSEDEKPKVEDLPRGTKRSFSTGAPTKKHASHDEVKIKEEPAKVVDICSEGEKPKGEKLQRGTKRAFSTGAPTKKHASHDEVKIKKEPAEVIEISSEDEEPKVEDFKREIVESSKKSTELLGQNGQTVIKRTIDLGIAIPPSEPTCKIKINRNKHTQSYTHTTILATDDDSTTSIEKSKVPSGLSGQEVNMESSPKTHDEGNKNQDKPVIIQKKSEPTQKVAVKEKQKKKGKEKQKNKVKQKTKKDGRDHDEITLKLSDFEKIDIFTTDENDPVKSKTYNFDENAEIKELDTECLTDVSQALSDDSQNQNSSKSINEGTNKMTVDDIPIRNEPIMQEVIEDEEYCSNAKVESIASTEHTNENIDKNAESKELDTGCPAEVSQALSDDSQNQNSSKSIDKGTNKMTVDDIPIRNEPIMQEVIEDEEYCSNAKVVSIASTEHTNENIDKNAESKESDTECLAEVSQALTDDSQNQNSSKSIDKGTNKMTVDDIPIGNEPIMQEVIEDEEYCSNAKVVSIASTEHTNENIDKNAESQELDTECLTEVSQALSDDSQNQNSSKSIDKGTNKMTVDDIPIGNEPIMQEVIEDEEYCSNAKVVSIASTEHTNENIDKNAESKESDTECLAEVSQALTDDSQNQNSSKSIDKGTNKMTVDDIPIGNEPIMQEVIEDEEYCSNAKVVSIASTEHTNENIDKNAESKELDTECLAEVSQALTDDSQNQNSSKSIDKGTNKVTEEDIPIRNEPIMQEVFEDEEYCSNAKIVSIASTEHSNITKKDNAGDEPKGMDAENPDLTQKCNTGREAEGVSEP